MIRWTEQLALFRKAFSGILLTCALAGGLLADDVIDGTADATKAIAAFRVPDGMKVELFAAEPSLGNPIAFCLDERGRVFVVETYRFNRGTEENRTRSFLLDDDLGLQTVDDRLAMFHKWQHKFDGGMKYFSKYADQIRLLEDTTGIGRADRSQVFAGGFNDTLDGLAAGVIARDGEVFFTCIPKLWRLHDKDGDGKADERTAIHHGFGVNAAFLGHDLHGLVWGPDGKLYFSVGDRGFHVKTKEGATLHGPRTGAVFRCNPDGSQLEVIHRGLRNPQELAFDQYGNLFAADNNCDKGDKSRLVYVVEGGESGWNMTYQTMPDPYLTGPWHAEKLWHLSHEGQPAWIVPPVGHLGAGPSGFTYYPGTGLPARWNEHFFMCNFKGNQGGIESFAVKPKGAAFEAIGYHDFLKPILATDVDFGYDGKMYVSDWVQFTWEGGGVGKGRIYTVHHPKHINDQPVQETRRLFHEGFKHRTAKELIELLHHADMRVRMRAQFALAEHGKKAENHFAKIAAHSKQRLARLHAIWGLGQLCQQNPDAAKHCVPLLKDSDAEIRAQAVKLLGDHSFRDAAEVLISLLSDSSLRVRYFAAMALGRLGHKPAIEPIFQMLRGDESKDPYLRHAAVMALLWIGDFESVYSRENDSNASVRMAVLLLQRRQNDARIARFLNDAEISIATEAARAINDLPIERAFAPLAKTLERFAETNEPGLEPIVRRAINANFRPGKPENAEMLVRFVANPNASPKMREEALAALADWESPSPRDRVIGFLRPLSKRDVNAVRQSLEKHVTQILANTSGKLQTDALALITRLEVKTDNATIFDWFSDQKRDVETRIAALRLLEARRHSDLEKLIDVAIKDDHANVRSAGRDVLSRVAPQRAIQQFEQLLASRDSSAFENRAALATLAEMKTSQADTILATWTKRLVDGNVPRSIEIDLVEAASKRRNPEIDRWLDKYEKSLAERDLLEQFRMCVELGDARRGRAIFVGHRKAQCIRCHKINAEGGGAGPDLSKVAQQTAKKEKRHSRVSLLESLIQPHARIAEGFGSVTLQLADGKVIAGTIKKETDEQVVLVTVDGKTTTVAKKDIDERSEPKSTMPAMDKTLTRLEMRDVLEFLWSLK